MTITSLQPSPAPVADTKSQAPPPRLREKAPSCIGGSASSFSLCSGNTETFERAPQSAGAAAGAESGVSTVHAVLLLLLDMTITSTSGAGMWACGGHAAVRAGR
ncbi:uncharacterized protein L3040_000908 [Drepanopeziza brunnea f. sp. 'multigermtubi']|uniref:Uncharacterized protein n=1 Tax=Marssonina brunnea f. sp. multigermtubi (strain MB_m1) TaxID=1072389 RepID=K1XJD2_MARBU|nr:uncharacterized protein MBM_01485 [Drepanopeziza brunnea f. sp. 'multigermtubi' MB_m1]EKD20803.1 hypothetical protein MBM_01485 [Drepanopeziza brunnea f. sp. 'multigermtubi' MB_m1]KAJ5054641.1 hypothetical protein L3040_000908 [Drepanopeziza brunnea f. sp. 'multigermtubi']